MIALVSVTFPDRSVAERIARAVVEERLAACANIGADVTSIYRWRGAIRQAQETPAIFKTTTRRAHALAARIAALHPDELPVIEWRTAETGPAARAWINQAVN